MYPRTFYTDLDRSLCKAMTCPLHCSPRHPGDRWGLPPLCHPEGMPSDG